MKMNERMRDAINRQINRELYSAYLYFSMSAFFESIKLKGFAHWMQRQAKEEIGHGMKLFNYMAGNNTRIILSAIEAPPTEWDSALDVFENVHEHEQKVTGMINNLVDITKSEDDKSTEDFLQWFVNEQVEEEENASKILNKIKKAESESELTIIDNELAQRK